MAITLSPKQLGTLADPDFCKRCFWIQHKMKFKMPYALFPGIFSALDKYQKNITVEYMNSFKRVPQWLNAFGEFTAIEPSPHWSKFQIALPNGILFRGVSDTLLRKTDGSLFILDEKTAMPKEDGHKLELLYDVQLNGYAKIANAVGLGPVSGLGIVYNVPQQLDEMVKVSSVVSDDSYIMTFKPVIREVKLNPGLVDELLELAANIIEQPSCPTGKSECGNCALIDQMAKFAI